MNIYVAGKNIERAKAVMDDLRTRGHTIAFDWVVDIDNQENRFEKAHQEREAIRSADALVYLWESDQEAARYEAGMAMGLEKPVVVSGKDEHFFFLLTGVSVVSDDKDICSKLATL